MSAFCWETGNVFYVMGSLGGETLVSLHPCLKQISNRLFLSKERSQ
jgi:hypothetical protein